MTYDLEAINTLFAQIAECMHRNPARAMRLCGKAKAMVHEAFERAATRPTPTAGDALDAARYRWARDNIQPDHDMPGGFWLSDEGGESWDRTIDAAIADQQGKGEA